MTPWDFLNIIFRAVIVAIVLFKLIRLGNHYNRQERTGLGIAGGCCLMTIPAIIHGAASPFAEWAGAMFAFGVMVYFGGRLSRTLEHERAAARQLKIARERKGL